MIYRLIPALITQFFLQVGSTSKKYAPIAAEKGCIVVDNSSAFRMDKDVPLVVPEVNPEEIRNNHGIIANPNCSTIQAVVALKPLDDKYKIKRIVYSTYQAVSGAGRNGVLDLENGTKDYVQNSEDIDSTLNPNSNIDYELHKFNYPIFSNCLPQIDVFLENGYTKEEEKMINETRKILKKPDLKITATTVRVPVFNSHSESINIEFENSFDMNELIETLSNAPGVIVQDNIEKCLYPLAINASGHDEVFVGRIRRDYSVENGINIWVVADNIRKGAASNAVQIVEKML
jgi:aspartate-semialdehyde dehydrogenase